MRNKKTLFLLFLLLEITGCSIYDGISVLTTNGDYVSVVKTNSNISIEQRYDSEYNSLNNPVNALFGSIDRSSAYTRSYYKLKSAPFDRYGEFEATFFYKCSYGKQRDKVSFNKHSGIGGEIKGILLPARKCEHRPYSYLISISEKPFNGAHTDSKGKVRLGVFRKGVFKGGIIKKPDGVIEFVKFDEGGYATGSWMKIFPSGKMLSGTAKKGKLDGDLYIKSDNGEYSYDHYENGNINTDLYFSQQAEKYAQEIFDKEVELQTRHVDRKLKAIRNEITQKEKILNSGELKETKDLIKKHWGGNNCYEIGLYLVREDPDMSYEEREHWRKVRKRRDQAKREICYAMNKLGQSLPGSVNADYSDPIKILAEKADLTQLDPNEGRALMNAIEAYRNVNKLRPVLSAAQAEKQKMVELLRRSQKDQKAELVRLKRLEIEAEKRAEAEKRNREFDAIMRCFEAEGYGSVDQWKVMPDGHYCQGKPGFSKFL